jgi:hypothetical protein
LCIYLKTAWCTPWKLTNSKENIFAVAFPGTFCGHHFMIEDAVLISSIDAMSAYDQCALRFSPVASYTARRLMLKFTYFNVTDCGVTLDLYNHPDANGNPDVSRISIKCYFVHLFSIGSANQGF